MIIVCYQCSRPAIAALQLDPDDYAPACTDHVTPHTHITPLPRLGAGMWRGLCYVIDCPRRSKYAIAKAVAGPRAPKAGYPVVDRLLAARLIERRSQFGGMPLYEATPLGARITVRRSAA